MSGHGGKRDGAGRKRGSRNATSMEIRQILDEVTDWAEKARKLNELADGILVQEGEGEKSRVYSKPPDVIALKTLFEFRFGKAPQQIQHANADDEPFFIVIDTK